MRPQDRESLPNPMQHPEEPPTGVEGAPRFGPLLIALATAVILIGLLAIGSEAYFS